MPMNASAEELAPPKLAATPPPFPACRRMAATSTRLSSISRTSKRVYSMASTEGGGLV
jgi:hypothetical protein